MVTFALICEGITDQILIERIIDITCGDMFDDGIDVQYLQPIRDATDAKTAPHGNWELVLEYCLVRINDALATNDFVIVHIDTDCGDHPNFAIGLTDGGVDRSDTDIIAAAKNLLISKIGQATYNEHQNRFILAISVHSIESWVLICHLSLDHPKNSFNILQREYTRKNLGNVTKEASCYIQIARKIKEKHVVAGCEKSESLRDFVSSLASLNE